MSRKEFHQFGTQVVERFHAIKTGDLCGIGRVWSELRAGPAFLRIITLRQEQNFRIRMGRIIAFCRCWSSDENRGAGLAPSREVIEIGIRSVAVNIIWTGWLRGSEEQSGTAIELCRKLFPSGATVGFGLTFARQCGRARQN